MIEKYSSNDRNANQFSLCLGKDGGLMTIGSINEDLHSKNDQPSVVFPYEDQKGFYTPIDVTQIRLGSEIMHGG